MFGVPIAVLMLRDRTKPQPQQSAPPFTPVSSQQDAALRCSGAFVAQFDGDLASSDLGTIFQFFVYPDRLVMIEVGGALNQLPSFLFTHGGSRRAIALHDYSAPGLPSLKRAQAIITEVNARRVFGLKTSRTPSREIMNADIRRIEKAKTFKYAYAMRVFLISSSNGLLFHFAGPEEAVRAGDLLRSSFFDRYAEQPRDMPV